MWPHQWQAEGKGHLPKPDGRELPIAAQEPVGLLCHQGELLTHGQLVNWEQIPTTTAHVGLPYNFDS